MLANYQQNDHIRGTDFFFKAIITWYEGLIIPCQKRCSVHCLKEEVYKTNWIDELSLVLIRLSEKWYIEKMFINVCGMG